MFNLKDWAGDSSSGMTVNSYREEEMTRIAQLKNERQSMRKLTDSGLIIENQPPATEFTSPDRSHQLEEHQIHTQQFLFKSILHMVDAAVIATDTSGKIMFLNRLAEDLTGQSLCDTQFMPLSSVFKVAHRTNLLDLEASLEKILQGSQLSVFSDDALLVNSAQNLIPINYSVSPIINGNQVLGTAIFFRSISCSEKTNFQNYSPLENDALTGLVSRPSFEDYLEKVLQDVKTLDQHHILCYLDLDRFKIINEVCGHFAGDEFLRQFSAVLQKRTRKTDVLARLGGDEFGLILQRCNLNQALGVLQSLQEEVRQFRFSWKNHSFNFTFSAGITLIHSDSGSGSDVLIEADSACAIAKGKGRDRLQVYRADDQELATQRGDSKGVLRVIGALEEDNFLLYCQPIVPVRPTNCLNNKCYYEILIRLQDSQGTLIPPNEFLPTAERYGLMHLIDRWVIKNLFKSISQNSIKAEKNSDKYTCHPLQQDCCYSINLSGSSFNDDKFLEFVQDQFNLYQIKPESICFEITETVAISNLSKAAQFIAQLRGIGCKFALDDFGSGMSSFGYLKNLPVDYIKIDGNFVKEITHSPIAYEIVKSINSIGHAMNIQTTAEFVENEAILTTLAMIGVDYMQGYSIAKPFPLQLS